MKKLLQVLLLPLILVCVAMQSGAQCSQDFYENNHLNEIRGKAFIDGEISDWQAIINDPTLFNRAIDNDTSDPQATCSDIDTAALSFDHPSPEKDINLLAFQYDQENVFLYFHREAGNPENHSNSFYYFFDVDADGFMNEGEPVFHATVTDNHVSSLTLSRYIPDPAAAGYINGKGNPLGKAINTISNTAATWIQGFPMPGNLQKVFTSNNIPHKQRLKKNEVFKAALTEEGLGVELSIPWKYLRYWIIDKKKEKKIKEIEDRLEDWLADEGIDQWFDKWVIGVKDLFGKHWKHTKHLQQGDIFFYKLSMKQGGGSYSAASVVDNAGNSCDGFGRSGDVSFDSSLTEAVFIPELKVYRFKATYTNRSNVDEVFDIGYTAFQDVKLNDELPPDDEHSVFSVKLYEDKNCNGTPDTGELLNELEGEHELDTCLDNFALPLRTLTHPRGKACFIIDVLPPDNFMSAVVQVEPNIWFALKDRCEISCALRTIKQVGIMRSSFSSLFLFANNGPINKAEQHSNPSQVLVYPNPNRGSAMVYLPAKEGAATIVLEDYSRRKMQLWKNYASTNLQINNLKPGFYLLRVYYPGKVETKKIVVQ